MAIEWGGESGHMQVGIDVRHDGIVQGTASVNIYVDYYVRTVNYGSADDQALSVGVNGSGWATWGYRMNSGYGQTTQVYVGTLTVGGQGLSYGGGPYYTFFGQISGSALGNPNAGHTRGFVLPARPPDPPSPPQSAYADSITGTTARIQWSAPAANNGAGVDLYEVRGANSPSMNPYSGSGGLGGGPFTWGGLAPGNTYYFQVYAHNAGGWSGGSNIVTVTTLNYPSAPQALVASNILPISMTVSWSAPASNGGAAVTQYEITIARDSGFTTGVQTFTTTSTSRSFTGLTPGTKYWFKVRALNSVGYGAQSTSIMAETLSGAKVRVAGAWVEHRAYAKQSGAMVTHIVRKRVSGAWSN